jgi:hypothetical protein
MKIKASEANRENPIQAFWTNPLPVIAGDETPYDLPPLPPTVLVHRGLPLDQLSGCALGLNI